MFNFSFFFQKVQMNQFPHTANKQNLSQIEASPRVLPPALPGLPFWCLNLSSPNPGLLLLLARLDLM